MPDTTSPSQQKTNDFFRIAFLTLLTIVLLVLSFLAGMLVQREILNKRTDSNANRNNSLTPTDTITPSPSVSSTPNITSTPSIQPTETRKTYTNSRYTFSLTHPSAWSTKEETNTKCNQAGGANHTCQYITVQSPNNQFAALKMEVTNNYDLGVLGNYSAIETAYSGYQRQVKQIQFNGTKLDRVLFIKDSSIRFICYIPSGYQCGKGVIPVQNLSIQMYVGNPAGDNNADTGISASDVETMDAIVESFKKV